MTCLWLLTGRGLYLRKFQQPKEPVSEWNDKSYSETKKVLERILDGDYKMSKKAA